MLEIKDKSKCMGCHACYNVCPKGCITMVSDTEGFLYPSIDSLLCVNCGLCERACPIINPRAITNDSIEAYAVKTKDDELRLKSSSGGVFTELAKTVTDMGGVVFGAGFDEDFNVIHSSAATISELDKFRGSKYVQSIVGNTYREAKELLENGKVVYFSGTPCQIGGLYSFLGRDYDNLITQDLICHGVPSPFIWKRYLENRILNSKTKPRAICFRDKRSGWNRFSMTMDFENGTEESHLAGTDSFIKGFLMNLCLRPSCYNCSFKTKIKQSDITLGDFWGAQDILPEFCDNIGISLVVLNSIKGKNIFKLINQRVIQKSVELDLAIKYNKPAIESVQKPKKRKAYMKAMQSDNFDEVTKRFCKPSLIKRLKRKIKKILKRK